jgi:hypothetical protein
MRRSPISTALTAAPFVAALLAAALPAQAAQAADAAPAAAAPVADYTVFLDPPTQFVFVKLPQGWKFAGRAEGALPARLPANVVTRLLPVDAE